MARRYKRRKFDQIRAEERGRVATFMERYAAKAGLRSDLGAAALIRGLASNVRADLCDAEPGWPELPLEESA